MNLSSLWSSQCLLSGHRVCTGVQSYGGNWLGPGSWRELDKTGGRTSARRIKVPPRASKIRGSETARQGGSHVATFLTYPDTFGNIDFWARNKDSDWFIWSRVLESASLKLPSWCQWPVKNINNDLKRVRTASESPGEQRARRTA